MKIIKIALVSLLIISFSCLAQKTDPKQIAQQVYQEIQSGISQEKANSFVDQYFNTYLMAQIALGINWRNLQDNEKKQYVEAFDKFYKKNLYNVLQNYNNIQIKDLNSRVSGNSAFISATILSSGNQPIHMMLPLEQTNNSWMAHDVIIENISLIQGYKVQFNALYKQNGIEALIDDLKKKS